jgi:uncharacterized protein
MDVTPLVPEGRQFIEAYGDGRFRITGQVWEGAVLVLPDRTIGWPIRNFDEVTLDGLMPVLAGEPVPEILLIGAGARGAFILPALRAAIRARGPVVDVMDTGAACRTYNVLLSEARRVAAALLPVGTPAPGGAEG